MSKKYPYNLIEKLEFQTELVEENFDKNLEVCAVRDKGFKMLFDDEYEDEE